VSSEPQHDPAEPPGASAPREAPFEFENFFQGEPSGARASALDSVGAEADADAFDAPRLTVAQQLRRTRLRRGVAVLVATLGAGSVVLFARRGLEPAPSSDAVPVSAVSVSVEAARAEPVTVAVDAAPATTKTEAEQAGLPPVSSRVPSAVAAPVKVARSARWAAVAPRLSRVADTGRTAQPSRAPDTARTADASRAVPPGAGLVPNGVASEPPTASFPAEHP
jgi:hypothetical protein